MVTEREPMKDMFQKGKAYKTVYGNLVTIEELLNPDFHTYPLICSDGFYRTLEGVPFPDAPEQHDLDLLPGEIPKENILEFRTGGEDETSGFQKADQGKAPLALLPFSQLAPIAQVLAFGAKKYGIDNWKTATKEDQKRYHHAVLRHLGAYLEGEKNDPESGFSHLAHAGCNILFMLYFEMNEPKEGRKE